MGEVVSWESCGMYASAYGEQLMRHHWPFMCNMANTNLPAGRKGLIIQCNACSVSIRWLMHNMGNGATNMNRHSHRSTGIHCQYNGNTMHHRAAYWPIIGKDGRYMACTHTFQQRLSVDLDCQLVMESLGMQLSDLMTEEILLVFECFWPTYNVEHWNLKQVSDPRKSVSLVTNNT